MWRLSKLNEVIGDEPFSIEKGRNILSNTTYKNPWRTCWFSPSISTPSPDPTAAGSNRPQVSCTDGKHMQWPDHEDKVKIQRYTLMPHETPSTMEQKDLWRAGYTASDKLNIAISPICMYRDPTNGLDTPDYMYFSDT